MRRRSCWTQCNRSWIPGTETVDRLLSKRRLCRSNPEQFFRLEWSKRAIHSGNRERRIKRTWNVVHEAFDKQSSDFADVRTYWSGDAVKRVTGYEIEGKAKEADGFIHLINSGAACLDANGESKDADGNNVIESLV